MKRFLASSEAKALGLSVLYVAAAIALERLLPRVPIGSAYGAFGKFAGSLTRAGFACFALALVTCAAQRAPERMRKVVRGVALLAVFGVFSGGQPQFLVLTGVPLLFFGISRILPEGSAAVRFGFLAIPFLLGIVRAVPALFGQPGSWLYPFQLYFRGVGLFTHLFLWAVDRYVYRNREADDFSAFLEYFFNPVFLFAQSQVYMVPFSFFQRMRKVGLPGAAQYADVYVKALLCVCLFAYFRGSVFPQLNQISSFPVKVLSSGTVNWLLVYLEHVGFASVQVLCGAGAGCWIPLDTKLPFLSRSFLEYFQRIHHYIRDCLVYAFVFPLQLWLRRRGVGETAAYLVSGTLGYAWILLQRMGPAPVDRFQYPWTTIPCFLLVFFCFGLFPSLRPQARLRGAQEAAQSNREMLRSIRTWRAREILGWAGNILINMGLRAATGLLAGWLALA